MSKYIEVKVDKLGRFIKRLEKQKPKDEKLIQAIKSHIEYFTYPNKFNTG